MRGELDEPEARRRLRQRLGRRLGLGERSEDAERGAAARHRDLEPAG